jgi:endonuclease/exonuclease/phosphatase family metal-dependent hydrolase
MSELVVATWNVLHRVHAVNWKEPAILAHPDEDARVAAISARLSHGLGANVHCLQEVSGDQLASLRATLRGRVFATQYPRVPHYFRAADSAPVPRDVSEHLVTIVDRDARVTHAEAFPTDGGKGFQVVELDGFAVISTHVSYGERHIEQCSRLADFARTLQRTVVIAGDFNADCETCCACLGPDFVAALLPDGHLPTRPRTDQSAKSQDIDHVFVRNGSVLAVEVVDAAGLSDHNPVVVTVRAG